MAEGRGSNQALEELPLEDPDTLQNALLRRIIEDSDNINSVGSAIALAKSKGWLEQASGDTDNRIQITEKGLNPAREALRHIRERRKKNKDKKSSGKGSESNEKDSKSGSSKSGDSKSGSSKSGSKGKSSGNKSKDSKSKGSSGSS